MRRELQELTRQLDSQRRASNEQSVAWQTRVELLRLALANSDGQLATLSEQVPQLLLCLVLEASTVPPNTSAALVRPNATNSPVAAYSYSYSYLITVVLYWLAVA